MMLVTTMVPPDAQMLHPCRARERTEDPADCPDAQEEAELGSAHVQRAQDKDGQENLDAGGSECGGRNAGKSGKSRRCPRTKASPSRICATSVAPVRVGAGSGVAMHQIAQVENT